MDTQISKETTKSIEGYIASFPQPAQEALQLVRATILAAVPGVEETISYAIPAFKSNGKGFVYFAGYKTHIGMYPVPTGHPLFAKDFATYKTSGKGAVQFPLGNKMPVSLIKKVVQFMHEEHLKSRKGKKKGA